MPTSSNDATIRSFGVSGQYTGESGIRRWTLPVLPKRQGPLFGIVKIYHSPQADWYPSHVKPEDELLTRAVEIVVPRPLADQKLKSGNPLRIYFGIDPTGNKLHIGHSVPLLKMRAFQDAGHEVIFLIGSFTAMIGDPSGRDQMRLPLTMEQVKENFQTYKRQASKILNFSKLKLAYNHEWLGTLNFHKIAEIASNFTVQQMLARETFKRKMPKIICPTCRKKFRAPIMPDDPRDLGVCITSCPYCNLQVGFRQQDIVVEEEQRPIGLHEFLYPLMQGYDSVMLDVDVEIGGNDQLFNMLCGRTLQAAFGKREKCVLTTKLIEGTDGRKMSKTYDNCIYLEDEPNNMYGKVLSLKDDLIPTYMECCTLVPMSEVRETAKALKGGKVNPKELKMRLARELVTMYHGKSAAEKAEREFEKVFRDKGTPEDIPQFRAKKGMLLVDALVESKTVASKSEARRLMEQGAIKVNDKPVTSTDAKVEEGIVKVGKRKFVKIIVIAA